MQKSRNIFWLIVAVIPAILCMYSSLLAQELEIVGSCEVPSTAKGIWISGYHAYLTGVDNVLTVINVSNPLHPIIESQINCSFWGADISVQGHYAYIAGYFPPTSIGIFDISQPSNPQAIGIFQSERTAHHIFVKNDYVFFANCTFGLRIINVSQPWNPYLAGIFDSLEWYEANGIYVDGQYAYLTEWYGGLYVLDVSDPTDPILVGHYSTGTDTEDIVVSGNYAYMTSRFQRLYILDISDPSDPKPLSISNLEGNNYNIFLSGNFLFVGQSGKFKVVDVSDPVNPTIIAQHEFQYGLLDVFVDNGYVFTSADHMFYVLRFSLTDVTEDKSHQISSFSLLQTYPNPFNSSTTINFTLAEPGLVILSIYNIQGQQVAELFQGIREAGEHSISWDASDYPSGVYFARLKAGGLSRTAKMLLLK